ncbi:hypothetical protein CHS0354_000647 [Potamilus streckersoni]|uniref:Uncharacterized protein n=1 Tax=Potamilus streckersoni TaxID=2493646 RepID=A0AAE0W946_9BIVA|nr:hypothetical protein CHS0354_000647 [Potamilus streckersoni]
MMKMTIENAYAIQNINTKKWLKEGRILSGRKIGLTSAAVQNQLGVNQPDFGMLFQDMAFGPEQVIPTERLLQPKVETEIALVLGKDLVKVRHSMSDIISATEYCLLSLEIVDSRIKDWKISIYDTIADNASSGLYVLNSKPVLLNAFDIQSCGMVMEKRGEVVSSGAGFACLGNPLNAAVWLADKMVEMDMPLKTGDVVLTGALGPMVSVQPGDVVTAKINGLGEITNSVRPMTGKEYIESLKDNREIWIYGEKVKDVTTHPAFRNATRMIARMYDAMHDEKTKNLITSETDTGNGGFTHNFFKTTKTVDDLKAARTAIAEWQKITYGWMGRSPEYKASFLGTLGANSDFYGDYKQNALEWYRKAQERVFYFNHAIVNPPVDRFTTADNIPDVCVHCVKETDKGIIVKGAKMVATGSALTNYNFISHYGMPVMKPEYALIFMADMNTPGVKLICRPSYEYKAAVMGSPFDYPLSSRLDENDSIMVFDNALIPWENVLMYRDMDKVNNFLPASGFAQRFTFQACIRLAVKLDFLTGLLLKGVEATGTNGYRGVQVALGEVIAWRNVFWALTDSMVNNPIPWVNGAVLPNHDSCMAYRALTPQIYPHIRGIFESKLGASLVYMPSHAVDFKDPQLRPLIDSFIRGSNGYNAEERVKLMKLIWDAIGSEFGARHELYERNYGGNDEDVKIQTWGAAMALGQVDALKAFADKCLSEYDLNGWTCKDLINNDDVTMFKKK